MQLWRWKFSGSSLKPNYSQGLCMIHAPVSGLDSDSIISGEPLQ